MKTLLHAADIEQKIRRIAYQIYEANFQTQALVLAGITGGGYVFAQRLQAILTEICPIPTRLVNIQLDKHHPTAGEVEMDCTLSELEGQVIVVTDDVLNTGRTLLYALRPLLSIRVARIQTAVLVNRNHKDFPISPDFVGYSLATTLAENIRADLSHPTEAAIYLE